MFLIIKITAILSGLFLFGWPAVDIYETWNYAGWKRNMTAHNAGLVGVAWCGFCITLVSLYTIGVG